MSFGNVYGGRRVLVTGNTGFKGSWLSAWLLELGAEVHGLAHEIPTSPAMFEVAGLADEVEWHRADLRDLEATRAVFDGVQPEFVFHLAAQAIVSRSYEDPVETFTTNVLGTAHVLDCLRRLAGPCTAVVITSDKAYDNVEWVWGYRENDALGGRDPYSGSKGAAEMVCRSFHHSFFADDAERRFAVGRAGNVIGGGDWSRDRIVVDCMNAWSGRRPVEIRQPSATRPWQHVLEPLSGYLRLGQSLAGRSELGGEAFNFGPRPEQDRTVLTLVTDLARRWGYSDPEEAVQVTGERTFHEATLLRLNCDKAQARLGWSAVLDYSATIRFVADWYRSFHEGATDMRDYTRGQIAEYTDAAARRGAPWAG